jgi:amino acid adenylation domain-containing protein
LTDNEENSLQAADAAQDEVGFPLAGQQRRLWGLFGERVPTVQYALSVAGSLERERLRHALQAAVDRYEILRTSFIRPPGLRVPLQVVHERRPISLSTGALHGLTGSERERRLGELLQAQRDEPLDLEGGPLLKAALLAGDGDHVLVLTAPGIVLDLRSLELLAGEVLLQAGEHGRPPVDEPLQYGDYAAWQQEQIDGGGTAAKEADGEGTPTALPLARRSDPGTATPAREHLEVRVALSAEAAARVGRLADDPQEAWLALWSLLVARLSGRESVTIAVTVDGRSQDELATALGPFARAVPVSVEIAPQASLDELLGAVGRARRAATAEQECRSPGGPSTEVGFTFAAAPAPPAVPGAQVELLSACGYEDLPPVSLAVHARADGDEVVLRWDAGALPAGEAERVARHLERLVASVLDSGASELGELDVLPEDERRRLLEDFSGRVAASPIAAGRVHWRFEEQAARTPAAPAVRAGERQLTYGELNGRANRLAHALRARGVGAGTVVALLLDRSPELIVSVLAVMKSGGAYLPLNPDHPAERLAFQLQDAAASLVLTQGALSGLAAELPGAALRVDEDLGGGRVDDPEHVGDGQDPVYLIYTSGSTGVPKGVEVTHAGLASYTAALAERLELAAAEPLTFGVVTTMSTDLGNTSVFAALTSGGCLELVPVEAAMDGEAFAKHLATHPLDVLKITPSHLAALLPYAQSAALPRRWLILGGEAAPWSLVEQVRTLGSCAIVNHYGPTETTVGSLTHLLDARAGALAPAATVPIGRPLAGSEIYIVDERLRPVPIGAPGELLIGGAGLARGYRNQPEQTASSFIAHPFAGDPGARVYRTGDIVRFLADGNVEFLGRADGQVKIRGFRVEVSEVETVLGAHPEVAQVAVVMREEAAGDQRLVAYTVGEAPTDELRAQARERLPDYMVPSAFVRLEALPLTPNGKLDRRALPAPDMAGAGREYVAPSTEVEQRLAEIWAQALGVERVGVQDDFFELGGHSLLATQVIARIRSAYDVQLPLHSLFTAPRIVDLAVEVTAATNAADEDGDAELSALLEDLEGLSDEEAERLLQLEASASEGQSLVGLDPE